MLSRSTSYTQAREDTCMVARNAQAMDILTVMGTIITTTITVTTMNTTMITATPILRLAQASTWLTKRHSHQVPLISDLATLMEAQILTRKILLLKRSNLTRNFQS